METPKWTKVLSPPQKRKLSLYIKELCYFNQSISLFSRRQSEEFCWNMILDSLLAGRILLKDSISCSIIADIGSGAGFPGIVLAVRKPSKVFWLYESNRKKADFLEYMVWKMDLRNVKVKARIQDEEAPLDCAVSKAFFSLNKRLLLTQCVFKPGASYYHFLTKDWKKQWEKLSPEVRKNWQMGMVKTYKENPFLSERVLLRTDFKI